MWVRPRVREALGMSQAAQAGRRGRAKAHDAKHTADEAPRDAARPFSVFVPAAPADAALRERLLAHLRPLEKAGLINTDHADDLASADIVLPIVSIDFLNSAQSSGRDMEDALERNRQRIGRVVPVIARPCLWDATLFAGLQALPPHARAISSSPSEEETLVDVVRGVRAIAEAMRNMRAG